MQSTISLLLPLTWSSSQFRQNSWSTSFLDRQSRSPAVECSGHWHPSSYRESTQLPGALRLLNNFIFSSSSSRQSRSTNVPPVEESSTQPFPVPPPKTYRPPWWSMLPTSLLSMRRSRTSIPWNILQRREHFIAVLPEIKLWRSRAFINSII